MCKKFLWADRGWGKKAVDDPPEIPEREKFHGFLRNLINHDTQKLMIIAFWAGFECENLIHVSEI